MPPSRRVVVVAAASRVAVVLLAAGLESVEPVSSEPPGAVSSEAELGPASGEDATLEEPQPGCTLDSAMTSPLIHKLSRLESQLFIPEP